VEWSQEFKIRLQVFVIGMAILGPSLLIWRITVVWPQLISYGWPSAQGVVEATSVKPWVNNTGITFYYGYVTYRYMVNEQTYESDRTSLSPAMKRFDQSGAKADVAAYRPGDLVSVYYDPNDPKVGVVARGIPTYHQLLTAVIALVSLVSLVSAGFVIRSWLRPKKSLHT
jgi:hypothetical protein